MRVLVATGQVATGEKGWLQVVGYSWLQASLNTAAAQASGLATALVTGYSHPLGRPTPFRCWGPTVCKYSERLQ